MGLFDIWCALRSQAFTKGQKILQCCILYENTKWQLLFLSVALWVIWTLNRIEKGGEVEYFHTYDRINCSHSSIVFVVRSTDFVSVANVKPDHFIGIVNMASLARQSLIHFGVYLEKGLAFFTNLSIYLLPCVSSQWCCSWHGRGFGKERWRCLFAEHCCHHRSKRDAIVRSCLYIAYCKSAATTESYPTLQNTRSMPTIFIVID